MTSHRPRSTPHPTPTQTLAIAIALMAIGALPAMASSNAASNVGAADLPEEVTWAGEIAGLVNEHCVSCHRPNDIAPMSLLSYDEARPWAKSMLKAVKDGVMPPWHADAAQNGVFENERRLSDRDVALLERWVEKGAQAGDLTAAPAPPVHAGGWRLGEPDLVVAFDAVALDAGGPDVFKDLQADFGLTEKRWIRALEVKPGDRRVVHHVILMASDGKSMPTSGWLGAWAAGMEPMVFPEGTAKLLEPGQKLIGDMHYHPAAEAATDQTQVGLYFYGGEPEKELINLWIQNSNFLIPAGAPDYVVEASHTFQENSTVYGLLPHMHYRGKEFTYTATYPDGRTEVLLHVPRYDFNWQTLYNFEQPLKMPKGSRIDCVAHFDNSTANLANPDPNRNVPFGPQSFDEMMIGFVDYVVDSGQRPMTVERQAAKLLADLGAQHPGEVWQVKVRDAEHGMEIDSVLLLPATGDGVWHIGMIGQLVEGKLTDVHYDGDSYTATLTAPFGKLAVEGKIEGDTISGKVSIGPQTLTYEGQRPGSVQRASAPLGER